ncbi:MAG: hypothetical protein AUJ51_03410 [Elusimicrobia bacterium CG1_02_56_21]|nr:MAG: hypothetical protein AUJ51_03410 [Elusimicrobia bacterium CG1_02_56_21]
MKEPDQIIITRKETMGLLGIQNSSLFLLEREAGITRARKRTGYSAGELRRLSKALQKVLRR